jgi:acyl carrier protein
MLDEKPPSPLGTVPMDVENELRAIIKKKAANADISMDTKLSELGLDSLDVVEIVFDIEDKFRIQLPQSAENMSSAHFRDLCQVVTQQVAAQPSGS